MTIIDLKIYPILGNMFGKTLGRGTHVRRTIDFCAGYGLHAFTNFSPLRGKISRRLQSQKVLVPRPVSLHGLRPNYLQGESAGYRGLSPFAKQETIPHGHPGQSIPVNSRRSQRKPRLANICRTCPSPYRYSQRPLQYRLVSRRFGRNRLCSRFNDYRPLPVSFSMGKFSQNQSSYQAPHIAGSEGKHSRIHPHFRWQIARCQRSRFLTNRSWRLLCHGSRISRLPATIFSQPDISLFRNPRKIKHQIQAALFAPSGQDNRSNLRPDNRTRGCRHQERLSGKTPSREVPRFRNRKEPCLPYEQLYSASINDSSIVSQSLAGGVVFQMDKATPQDQNIFRDVRKCREIPNLDRCLSLRSCSHHEEAAQSQGEPLHNFTDYKRYCIRENIYISVGYRDGLQNRNCPNT